jgi:hypothetical protein
MLLLLISRRTVMISLQEELLILLISLRAITPIRTRGFSTRKNTEVGQKVKIKIHLPGQTAQIKRNSYLLRKNRGRKKL